MIRPCPGNSTPAGPAPSKKKTIKSAINKFSEIAAKEEESTQKVLQFLSLLHAFPSCPPFTLLISHSMLSLHTAVAVQITAHHMFTVLPPYAFLHTTMTPPHVLLVYIVGL